MYKSSKFPSNSLNLSRGIPLPFSLGSAEPRGGEYQPRLFHQLFGCDPPDLAAQDGRILLSADQSPGELEVPRLGLLFLGSEVTGFNQQEVSVLAAILSQ